MKDLKEIREIAFKAHADTNHMYDGMPYAKHLEDVARNAYKFSSYHCYDGTYLFDRVIATAYFHDAIEDARLTYNDVFKATGSGIVAEAAFMLTNLRGRTRKERANDEYYDGASNNEVAAFVKLMDRIANMEHSKKSGNRMYEMYKEELPKFLKKMNADKLYPEIAEYLRSI